MLLQKFEKSPIAKLVNSSAKKWIARGEHSSKGTPPRLRSESSHTERGITLQTLIVTAVLVLVAVGAAVVLVAINRSSSDDFEEAGNIGIEGKCETWEIHLATLEAAGHGGPEGHGGVFSSNIGCLATCYWELSRVDTRVSHSFYTEQWWPGPYFVRNVNTPSSAPNNERWPFISKLLYYDDNRAPIAYQVRLGVVYNRGGSEQDHKRARNGLATPPKEGEWVIRWRTPDMNTPGRPLTQAQIARPIPTVVKPNWFSYGPDPGNVVATGYTARPDPAGAQKRYSWEDESWEVRADPGREVCEIVNVANDDLLVCSSAKEKCEYTT